MSNTSKWNFSPFGPQGPELWAPKVEFRYTIIYAKKTVVFNNGQKMALSNNKNTLLHKPLSAPSFGRYWRQLIGSPYNQTLTPCVHFFLKSVEIFFFISSRPIWTKKPSSSSFSLCQINTSRQRVAKTERMKHKKINFGFFAHFSATFSASKSLITSLVFRGLSVIIRRCDSQ